MMKLYEIETRKVGESYVRCYVWAPSIDDAHVMFREKYPHEAIVFTQVIFRSSDDPFITELSDSGFQRKTSL